MPARHALPRDNPTRSPHTHTRCSWHSKTLQPTAVAASGETTYAATPPAPTDGHWTGYYIEVYFSGEEAGEFMFTTPGRVWPDTLPFADCHGKSCVPRLV